MTLTATPASPGLLYSLPEPPLLVAGTITLCQRSRTVTRNGRQLVLSRLEFDLLRVLITDPTRVFTREELRAAVWPADFEHGIRSRSLDVHASRLRRKLGPGYIVSVWRIGYRLMYPRTEYAPRCATCGQVVERVNMPSQPAEVK